MFRLIKLALYGVLGYVIYEFIQGMLSEPSTGSSGGRRSQGQRGGSMRRDLRRALNEDRGRTRVAGEGGAEVKVEDASGASHRQRVGRGVT